MEITEILARCKNGEAEAWNMLINSYSKAVYNIALNFFADKDIAADVTQDIFLKIYNNLEKFKEEKNFTAWLFTISRNYCIDYWRKNKKYFLSNQELDEKTSAHDPSPEDHSIRDSEIVELRRKIARLDPELRVVLILRDIQDLSYQEIAAKFSIPEGTVKSRINRARLKLAQSFMRGEQ
jgi:RNA polymerase sigma-70 factor (ECF subfamily)